jgi:hypothetical protein
MKTVFGFISGIMTVVSLICTALWFWIGVATTLLVGVKSFMAGSGVFAVVFAAFGWGILAGVGTLVLGLVLTGVLGLVTNKLLN